MSSRKKDAAEPQEATVAMAVAAPRQTLPNPATTKRVSTIIPMGMRDDVAPEEIDDVLPSSPASAEVAQSSSSGPAPETVRENLTATFARQYQTVCRIDEALARLEIKKRRTLEYWELGQIASQLKEIVGHGKWGAFLKGKYAERTVQRAMHIYAIFHDHKDDCAELTLEQAEQFGKAKKTEPPRQAVPTSTAPKEPGTTPAPEVAGGGESRAEASETDSSPAPLATEQRETAPTAEVTGGDKAQSEKKDQAVETLPATLATGHQRTAPAAEVAESGEAQVEAQVEDEAREEKRELLWAILAEATDLAFALTDAEREAFAAFMATIGDEDRAVRVLLHSIWNTI